MTDTMKTCVICLQDLSLDSFHKDRAKSDGLRGHCKTCSKTVRRAYYIANREEYKAKMRDYSKAHKPQIREAHRKVRRDALEAYGGRCACCDETTFEFLAIDHVNNDGEEHRRELGAAGRAIYHWLKRQDYPQDGRFQVLCHNCNMAKGLYGLCPHRGKPPGIRAKILQREASA